nr:hypothetical protein [Tanacetum cinerariifolium]
MLLGPLDAPPSLISALHSLIALLDIDLDRPLHYTSHQPIIMLRIAKTLCETIRLDYNKGNYVVHPPLEVINVELAKIAINEGNTQLAIKGFHSPLNEGTRKSKHFLEGKPTDVKDPGETNNPLVSNPDYNKGKTSYEVEPDTDTLILTIFADIQALLGDYEDELKDDSNEELLEAGEEMDEEFLQNLQGFSEVLYAQFAEDNWEKHEEVVASYADLKWSIDDFHATTFKQYENTIAALRNYERILDRVRTDHVTGLNRILNNLQEVQTVVKKDLAHKKKGLEAAKAYTKISTNLIVRFIISITTKIIWKPRRR